MLIKHTKCTVKSNEMKIEIQNDNVFFSFTQRATDANLAPASLSKMTKKLELKHGKHFKKPFSEVEYQWKCKAIARFEFGSDSPFLAQVDKSPALRHV